MPRSRLRELQDRRDNKDIAAIGVEETKIESPGPDAAVKACGYPEHRGLTRQAS